jgi:hypothetical protein
MADSKGIKVPPTGTHLLVSVKTEGKRGETPGESGETCNKAVIHLVLFREGGTKNVGSLFEGSSVTFGEDTSLSMEIPPQLAKATEWMCWKRFTPTALKCALGIMKGGESVTFYDKGGNVVELQDFDSRKNEILYICLNGSFDGKSNIYAVSENPATMQNALSKRYGGIKVTYSVLKGDSAEVISTEVPANMSAYKRFFQSSSQSSFTVAIGAITSMLSLLIRDFLNGTPVSLVSIIGAVITFGVFMIVGMAVSKET